MSEFKIWMDIEKDPKISFTDQKTNEKVLELVGIEIDNREKQNDKEKEESVVRSCSERRWADEGGDGG